MLRCLVFGSYDLVLLSDPGPVALMRFDRDYSAMGNGFLKLDATILPRRSANRSVAKDAIANIRNVALS